MDNGQYFIIPTGNNSFSSFIATYGHIENKLVAEIVVIVCTVFGSVICLYVFLGLCISRIVNQNKNEKKRVFRPSARFKKSFCTSVEDSIYFSEISPSSSDSLSSLSGNSLLNSRNQSTVSVIPEKNSSTWIPWTISKKFNRKFKIEPPSTVYLFFKYTSSDEQTERHGKLHIAIKDIFSLPRKDYPHYTEGYIVIRLVRSERGLKGRTQTIVYENRTQNFKNSRDIKVEEYFIVDTRKYEWKHWNLTLTVYDQDIYTKVTELASTTISLSRKYKDITSNPEGFKMAAQLKPTPKNECHLLVGLSYLPTSQRLSVNILKAVNLNQAKEPDLKMYAQLFLLTGATGKSLKRKKLIFFHKGHDPYELNGTLSFDVNPHLLENVTLLIIFYKKGQESELNYENVDGELSPKFNPRDHCFGSVALGKLVNNQKGKKHWRMMMMSPRRIVTVWHSLK